MAGLNMRASMGKIKKAPKEILHIRVQKGTGGGTAAYHDHTDPAAHPSEGPHVFAEGESHPVMEGHLFHHLAQHLGIPHHVMGAEEEPEHEMEEEEMAQ